MIKTQLKDGEGIHTYCYIYIHTGMYRYILLYLKWLTNKGLLYSTRNPAQCYVAAWGWEGSLGENGNTYVYAESLCCSPKTIPTLLVNQQ